MKCGIRNCVQQDDRFVWSCHGTCNRTFHAACVGAQRNHEEILRTFMLPLCQDCQDKFISELNLKVLTKSLDGIANNIGSTLEANHKMLHNFKNLSATHDHALEHIENMLDNIQHSLAHITSSNKKIVTEIKSATESLSDTPSADTCTSIAAVANAAATAAVEAVTTTTTHSLDKLITTLKNDLADSHAALACDVKLNMEQLTSTISKSPLHTSYIHTTDEPTPSWRMLGSKKVWKYDWSEYDAKQRSRRRQEKNEDKARRRRKQRNKKIGIDNFNISDNNNNNNKKDNSCRRNDNIIDNDNNINNNKSNNNNNSNNNINDGNNSNNIGNTGTPNVLPLDRELLAAARIHFSRPPTDNGPNFINFQKGETINPYRPEKAVVQEHPPLLDPMRPPIVRLTEQSASGDQRLLKARLRDPKIMDIVRTYLSFLHDQPATTCIRGITNISASLKLAAEGLPKDPNHLRDIFLDVHEELGVARNDALADLASYRAFLSSERTQRLQSTREAALKFYTPSNFQRR